MTPQSAPATSATTLWRGRTAHTLTNGLVEATLLPGGGHLAAWRFVAGNHPANKNVLWESPWATANPCTPQHKFLASLYGAEGVGEFLASFTGHALCLDGFGPPSNTELLGGAALHGEAATSMWHVTSDRDNSGANFTEANRHALAWVELSLSRLRVERRFELAPAESVLRVDERVTNMNRVSRNLHWVQHATVSATPKGSISASLRDGITAPFDYDGHNLLARGAEFQWPHAPGAQGEQIDLRKLFSTPQKGFVAAAHQAPHREHGFVAMCDPGAQLMMGYVFSAKVFPWIASWEENFARKSAPWLGRVQARGLEFGTTPLPLGNVAVDAGGPVFGRPVSRSIAAGQTLRAPWLLFIAPLPDGWGDIEDIRVDTDEIVVMNSEAQVCLMAQGAAAFLGAPENG